MFPIHSRKIVTFKGRCGKSFTVKLLLVVGHKAAATSSEWQSFSAIERRYQLHIDFTHSEQSSFNNVSQGAINLCSAKSEHFVQFDFG